jgi:ubiquinone/menaquinone biosynthesis C-methylase UbiE
MANVFHGFVFNNEVDQVMSEIRRLLKPDGRLALVEFEKIKNTPGPSLDHRVDLPEVKNAMQGQGLIFIKELKVGPYHYAAVFKLD